MKRQLKYLAFKILMVLGLLFFADYAVGIIFQSLTKIALQKAPNASRTEYVVKKVNADILIMGNSRASHHYVPSILSNSLNKSVFNCGLGGQGFSYTVAMIHAVLKRYSPEIIIVDINPMMLAKKTTSEILNELYPYYNDDEFFKEIINQEDPNNRFKMQSKMYRYNSQLVSLLRRVFLADFPQENGYGPLSSKGYQHPSLGKSAYESNDLFDSKEGEILQSSIDKCKKQGINLIFSISPRFQESNVIQVPAYIHLKELLEKNNIPLIYMGDNSVINDSTMYKDNAHLNHLGALVFTEAFMRKLKEKSS